MRGINDAGEIAGVFLDADGNNQSFLDNNGVISPIVDPLAANGASLGAVVTTFTITVDDGLVPTVTDSAATATVSSNLGGGQTVAISGAPGSAASLHGAGGDWDIVNGDGHAGNVYFTNAQASVYGGSIVSYFDGNSNDAASLNETANNWDTVHGGNGAITLTSAPQFPFV